MYQKICIEELPTLPRGLDWEKASITGNASHEYAWVRTGKYNTPHWCIDQYHDGDRLFWRIEEKGQWNRPMDDFYGYESIQQAAQVLINYITVAVDLDNLSGD